MANPNAVIVHDAQHSAVMGASPQRGGLVRLAAPMADIIAQHKELDALIEQNLEEGENKDYGPAPGAKKKDKKRILYKSGAEKVNKWHGVYPQYEIIEKEVDHDIVVPWRKVKRVYNNRTPDDKTFVEKETEGTSLGLYRYVVRCSLIYRATGEIIGDGIGACSTLESKYIDRPRDLENTVVKMAQKRALLAATLNAYALSDRFTQDLEDMPSDDDDERVETRETRKRESEKPERAEDVDERGVPIMVFGADAIRGKSIDDAEHISIELLVAAIAWLLSEKGASARARFKNFTTDAISAEIKRRIATIDGESTDLRKTIKWIVAKDERKAAFQFVLDAASQRYADLEEAALKKQQAESAAGIGIADDIGVKPTEEVAQA